jgi:hypothetical protein
MDLPLPFKHGLSVGYVISSKIMGETMIEAWNVFTGAGENSHQWIYTPFFHRWANVMADGGKKMALCWGQAGTGRDIQHGTTDQPRSMAPTSGNPLLLLESLAGGPGKSFKGDEDQVWNEFTAQAMASIPEDVCDDRYILSMTDLMDLIDLTSPTDATLTPC